jgi:hypothetical protein
MEKPNRIVGVTRVSAKDSYSAVKEGAGKEQTVPFGTSALFRAGKMSNVYLRRRERLKRVNSEFGIETNRLADELGDGSVGPVAGRNVDSTQSSGFASTRPSTQVSPMFQAVSPGGSLRIPTPSPRGYREKIAWSELFFKVVHESYVPN